MKRGHNCDNIEIDEFVTEHNMLSKRVLTQLNSSLHDNVKLCATFCSSMDDLMPTLMSRSTSANKRVIFDTTKQPDWSQNSINICDDNVSGTDLDDSALNVKETIYPFTLLTR